MIDETAIELLATTEMAAADRLAIASGVPSVDLMARAGEAVTDVAGTMVGIGARIAEVPIRNSPRPHGGSHYGLGRTLRVLFDILTIRFLLTYFTRPMHFFGKLGFMGTAAGGAILTYLLIFKIMGGEITVQHGPLMVAGGLLLLAGLLMFCTGLQGEVMIRVYFASQGRRIYAVREIRGRREPTRA